MSQGAEVLIDRLLARLEDTRGFKAWYSKLGDEAQHELLIDLEAVVKLWMRE